MNVVALFLKQLHRKGVCVIINNKNASTLPCFVGRKVQLQFADCPLAKTKHKVMCGIMAE